MAFETRKTSDLLGEKCGVPCATVETNDLFTTDAVDPVYLAKSRVLNNAIQEIGMGRYQVCVLIILCAHQLNI